MIRFVLPIVAFAAAAACTYGGDAQTAAPVSGKCVAEGLESLVGKTRSDTVAAEAQRLSGAKTLRWITPDMMVTMEFREDRLNLHLGTDGKIGSARCG